MQNRIVAALLAVLSFAAVSSLPVQGGLYSDEMAKCLVRSTTDDDKNFLVRWMFALVSLHPAVKDIAAVSDAQRTDLNRGAAKLLEKLIAEACTAEVKQAVKYEGKDSIGLAFRVFGQVAANGLFTDPSVAKGTNELEKFLDEKKLEESLKPSGTSQ
jgi:hypothetical protein